MAAKLVMALANKKVVRLVFISSMGIYNEIPAEIGSEGNLDVNPILQTYRRAAAIIENSSLPSTIIRPGWFIQGPVSYEVTHKGEPFGGHDVSITSIADLVLRLRLDEKSYLNESIGINQIKNN